MDLLQWAMVIMSLVASKRVREAVLVLLFMWLWRTVTDDSILLMALGAEENEIGFTTFLDDQLSLSRKRKRPVLAGNDGDDSDDEDEILEFVGLASYFLDLLHAREPRRQRRWWKAPSRSGNLFTKIAEWDDRSITSEQHANEKYFEAFRIRCRLFDMLTDFLEQALPVKDQHPNLSQPLTPKAKLCITMYWIARGCYLAEVADIFNVGVTTVHVVIREVKTCLSRTH